MDAEHYFLQKARHSKERADYHADMAAEGINPEYHLDQEARAREEDDKLTEKARRVKKKKKGTKKDIGPMANMTIPMS
jgi:hypothetical protein